MVGVDGCWGVGGGGKNGGGIGDGVKGEMRRIVAAGELGVGCVDGEIEGRN